ncbi:LADA_0D00848g1_1 [Lachancea dasiensis]|uniref:LADA_0D00848g1_1 n=1 Tax=Lachancea dasiensis TaxID=1072105 RepID=A0A1G4J484_9SACH|nr:LADA_0D00848g1_1 [Lachancea dasiensis]
MDKCSEFVSCASVSADQEDTGVMMCQTRFSSDGFKTPAELPSFKILDLIASEGSDVITGRNLDMSCLICFAGADRLKSWLELVIFLSGGWFVMEGIDRSWAYNGQWTFYYAYEKWKLVFETQHRGFAQRFCELPLDSASQDLELDLFGLGLTMYKNLRRATERIHALELKCFHLEKEKLQMQQEERENDLLIRRRDDKTRAVVVALLNEKKDMIRKLEENLEQNRGPLDLPDEALMNRFVSQPVSRMTSPRKRAPARVSSTPSPSKKRPKPLVKHENSWDDFADKGFEIRGINRERTPARDPSGPLGAAHLRRNSSLEKSSDGVQTGSPTGTGSVLEHTTTGSGLAGGADENLDVRSCSSTSTEEGREFSNDTQSDAESDVDTEAETDPEL